MKIVLCVVALIIIGFAFYQMIFGGSKKPQDPVPPERLYGGGMGQ